jgi:transposase
MSNLMKSSKVSSTKIRRTFSEELKRKIVKEFESGKVRISELCRAYDISDTSIYNWVKKYSPYTQRGEQIIVESKSETRRVLELSKKTSELERVIGQKQITIEYLEKVISLANKELGVDLKKNSGLK